MTKLILILICGLIFEAIGVVFLSRGLKQVGELAAWTAPEIGRFILRSVTSPQLLFGVFCEAIFFGSLLYLMRSGDVSFVWPLTSLGYVLTTLAARFILKEIVPPLHWTGVILIVLGAALITFSEKAKERVAKVEPVPEQKP